MNFSALKDIFRNDVLASIDQSLFSDATYIYPILYRSSAYLASILGIPRKDGTVSVSAGDNEFNVPSDLLDIRPGQLVIGAWILEKKSWRWIKRYQSYPDGFPEYYHIDTSNVTPKVIFAPGTDEAADADFEYIVRLEPTTMTPSTEVWQGAYPAYHMIVSWEAGFYAYSTASQYEEAKFWASKAEQGVMSLARLLGHNQTEIDTMIAQMQAMRSAQSNAQ